MKILLTFAFALSLGILALSFQIPGRTAALGNDQGCFRALYTRPHIEAQVALIGSSRIRRGLDPDRMAAELGLPQLGVVNLAHPGTNLLLDFEILDEMLEQGLIDPEVIVAGVVPTSWRQHEMEMEAGERNPFELLTLSNGRVKAGNVAMSRLDTLTHVARAQEPNSLMALWNGLVLHRARLEQHIQLALGGRSIWDVFFVAKAVDADRSNQCFRRIWAQNRNQPERIAQKGKYEAAFAGLPATGALDPQDFLTNTNYLMERIGLQKTAALAKARGIRAYALYIPGVHTAHLPQEFLDRFEAEIGMTLLTFPPDLRQALGTELYADPTHLGPEGRQMASDWLAGEIKADLRAQ